MKYLLTWTEGPQGAPIEYENAQKRILEVFTRGKAPEKNKEGWRFYLHTGTVPSATWI